MKQTLEKAAKEYADGLYDPDNRGILYRETKKTLSLVRNGRQSKQLIFYLPSWIIGYMAVMPIVLLPSLKKN